MIARKDLDLFVYAESAEEVWQKLTDAGVGLHAGEQAADGL